MTPEHQQLAHFLREALPEVTGCAASFATDHAPVRLPAAKVKRELDIGVCESINLDPSYNSISQGFADGRELIQNWSDRCRMQSEHRNAPIELFRTSRDSDTFGFYGLFATPPASAPVGLGYICEWRVPDPTGRTKYLWNLQITNYGTHLPPDILIMGRSEHEGSTQFAGAFGEGMKVEINKLVSGGASVVCATGGRLWTFAHRPGVGLAGPDQRVFVVSVDAAAVPSEHTTILVRGVSQRLDPMRYLFLLPESQRHSELGRNRFPALRMELLTDEQHRGKAFVHGIFMKRFSAGKLSTFSFNYTGPASTYAAIGLTRERNDINLESRIVLTAISDGVDAVYALPRHLNLAMDMRRRVVGTIYSELNHKHTGLRNLCIYGSKIFFEALHEYFRWSHGDNKDEVPVESDVCPLAIEAGVRMRAEHRILLGAPLQAPRERLKQVVILTKTDAGAAVLIINADFFFDWDAVHRRLRDDHQGVGGACGRDDYCGCVRGLFLEQVLENVFRNRPSERKRRERDLMNRCLGLLPGNLPPGPEKPQQASSPPPRTAAAVIPESPAGAPSAEEQRSSAQEVLQRCLRGLSAEWASADAIADALNRGRGPAPPPPNARRVLRSPQYAPRLEQEIELLRAPIAQFWKLLVDVLGVRVFGLPRADAVAKLRLFWDDSTVIAFNKGGSLFFNMEYWLRQCKQAPPAEGNADRDRRYFWFVVFCHELAHNVAKGHGKDHESAEEVLLQMFMGSMFNVNAKYLLTM
ncbi:hypothetical protein JKP88DRAFT_251844 [Tribonema minus]|uniref:Uncharacterized protein n=1 Tax=Tribonema minus TaxID=303371 RepID=A0A835ZBW3_9STRA|nr:hypothetical protein JKP88DRAFT_251844 [Tribonema minus]